MNKQWKPTIFKEGGVWYWRHDYRTFDLVDEPLYYERRCYYAMHFCHRLNAQVRYEKL